MLESDFIPSRNNLSPLPPKTKIDVYSQSVKM